MTKRVLLLILIPLAARLAAQSKQTDSVLVAEDWNRFGGDRKKLRQAYNGRADRRIWNFGGAAWELVSLDSVPLFGWVAKLPFPQQTPFYNLAAKPKGLPGSVTRVEVTLPSPQPAIWVRFYHAFEPGFRTKEAADRSPLGGSYKLFFMHWSTSPTERFSLVYSNTTRLAFELYQSGNPSRAARPKSGNVGDEGLSPTPHEFVSGEWYEFVALYRQTDELTSEACGAVREYSTGNRTAVAPGPWRWICQYRIWRKGAPLPEKIEFGGNKNHGNEITRWRWLGPFEVRVAPAGSNPFGTPFF